MHMHLEDVKFGSRSTISMHSFRSASSVNKGDIFGYDIIILTV